VTFVPATFAMLSRTDCIAALRHSPSSSVMAVLL
jgi:hypothetical protein